MRISVYKLLPLLLSVILCSCRQELPELAPGNRWSLYCTLAYYKYIERDTLKYAAARFLIDNMQYHYSNARIQEDNDTLARWRQETDNKQGEQRFVYYDIIKFKDN